MSAYETFYPFIKELAFKSGEAILPYFANSAVVVERKEDESPVTVADRKSEEIMRQMINRRYPDHGIIGEEFGEEKGEAEFVWVLDPIDGTKSFASACPLFGTLIALLHRGQPVLGAVHMPALRQLLIGDGHKTTLNDQPVRVRQKKTLAEATLLTTDYLAVEKHHPAEGFERLIRKVRLFRTWGDCYMYLLLASGWADIAIDPVMEVWDIQALIPVVRGAGGVISGWDGGNPVEAHSIVAASPSLHGIVIGELNRH
jgi:histidinol phosphatase-like enzyme (inositol monophosphatase family)